MNLRFAALILVILCGLAACTRKSEVPPDLSKAVAVVSYLTSPRYVDRSMYSAVAQSGLPSEFISFLFSSLGAAERPESSSARPPDAGKGGPPTWPDSVAFHAHKPDLQSGMQVVVMADDARGIVIAEGYISPSAKPVVRSEFTLAKPKKQR